MLTLGKKEITKRNKLSFPAIEYIFSLSKHISRVNVLCYQEKRNGLLRLAGNIHVFGSYTISAQNSAKVVGILKNRTHCFNNDDN
jgi:hypothetical protein